MKHYQLPTGRGGGDKYRILQFWPKRYGQNKTFLFLVLWHRYHPFCFLWLDIMYKEAKIIFLNCLLFSFCQLFSFLFVHLSFFLFVCLFLSHSVCLFFFCLFSYASHPLNFIHLRTNSSRKKAYIPRNYTIRQFRNCFQKKFRGLVSWVLRNSQVSRRGGDWV